MPVGVELEDQGFPVDDDRPRAMRIVISPSLVNIFEEDPVVEAAPLGALAARFGHCVRIALPRRVSCRVAGSPRSGFLRAWLSSSPSGDTIEPHPDISGGALSREGCRRIRRERGLGSAGQRLARILRRASCISAVCGDDWMFRGERLTRMSVARAAPVS